MKKIITHSGIHHADDVVAVCLASIASPEAQVVRGNPDLTELTDPSIMVIDVGNMYDPAWASFDHHQRGFDLARPNGSPMAATGLVWWHGGVQDALADEIGVPAEDREEWARRLDIALFEGIDRNDCGKGRKLDPGEAPSISQLVSWLNAAAGATSADRDLAFAVAVGIVRPLILGAGRHVAAIVAAKKAVLQAEATNGVLLLPTFVPWAEHIFSRADVNDLLYVIFPSERGGFMVQQIPDSPGSFKGKKPLPEAWRGLPEADLAAVTGVADATFCHANGFCAAAGSLAGAQAMAKRAIEA